MPDVLLYLVSLVGGVFILGWSADQLVDSTLLVAKHYNIPPAIVGVTIIAFGTSAPELLITAMSVYQGVTDLAVGNAVGSCIINVGLILSIAGILTPLQVSEQFLRREIPVFLIILLIAAFVIYSNSAISSKEGWVLLISLVAYCIFQLYNTSSGDDALHKTPSEPKVCNGASLAVAQSLLMIAVLVVSSKLLVWAATHLAAQLGVSDLIVGLTVVAIGTSMPELAAILSCVKKGAHDMALSTIIGSNIVNLLGALAIPALFGDRFYIDIMVLGRDVPVMLLLTLVLVVFIYSSPRGISFEGARAAIVSRKKSGSILLLFSIYTIYLCGGGS